MNIIDAGLEFGSNKTAMTTVKGIVLHHTAVTVEQSVEVIHNYHKSKGWAGIGYHFYVRKDGSIYKGRPVEYRGAHCVPKNTESIGICAEGNFEVETMSDAQKNSIKELVAYLKTQYNIEYIGGHREYDATTCPGANYPIDEIKNAEGAPVPQPTPAPAEDPYKVFVGEVQAATGARVDRIAGPETLSKTITVSAKKNNRHPVVRAIQKYYKALGYNEVGEIDGIAGPKFTNTTKHFQQDHGCVVDGEITAKCKTWKKLLKLA